MEKDKREKDFQKAKKYVFLLLKFRLRGEKEVEERLRRKSFEEETIKKTLSFLREEDFLDDNYFAKAWIESRIKKNLGFERLAEELRIKGIDRRIIDKQIEQARKDYSEEKIVFAIVRERMGKLRKVDPQSAKRRIFAYLSRRGFSAQISMDVLAQMQVTE